MPLVDEDTTLYESDKTQKPQPHLQKREEDEKARKAFSAIMTLGTSLCNGSALEWLPVLLQGYRGRQTSVCAGIHTYGQFRIPVSDALNLTCL